MSRRVGSAAEEAAARLLEREGYEILARNYTIRGAEVDIIAKERDVIAFVEVKYRARAAHGLPREAVGMTKRRRMGMAALRWLQENGLAEANIRFDVVELMPGHVEIIRGAFDYVQ